MKNFTLLFAFLFLQNGFCQNGNYHPFPNSNAMWFDEFESWGIYTGREFFLSNVDTLIVGFGQGKIVYFRQVYQNGFSVHENFNENYQVLGVFQQDTISKKVWFALRKDTIKKKCLFFSANFASKND